MSKTQQFLPQPPNLVQHSQTVLLKGEKSEHQVDLDHPIISPVNVDMHQTCQSPLENSIFPILNAQGVCLILKNKLQKRKEFERLKQLELNMKDNLMQ